MKKKIIGIIIVVVFTVITVYLLANSKEIAEFPELVKRLEIKFLYIAISLMLLYLVINSTIIYIIGKEISREITFMKSVYLSFVGQYYSLITPFAAGGQPAQIIAMKTRYNIPISVGTTITVKKFLIFQVVVSLYAISMFFTKIHFIMNKYSGLIVFIVIGLSINLIGGVLIILLSYSKTVVVKILDFVILIAKKLHLGKRIKRDSIIEHIDDYVKNIEEIKNNKKTMLTLIVMTFIQLTIYFSITYFIYLSLGSTGANYIDILGIQTIVYVVVSFIPTPGGAGASEGSFYLLFKVFFSRDVLLYAMALWRIITYYGNMIFSGLILLLVRIFGYFKKKKKYA
ncbi:lysylphosphatidylglycerol synthase transmembrane domain-containing protein [Vallitalea guaymasensis]|uniref:Phosphatidylglycerol lysyltransferase n=1 Tax=Vallitalea guaymasensis TaxID=1185412 RepID=A0A8J8SBN9_9FIRM|nr:lysylphosphatidylglycerol synthase transmembrane domain-containing protein [Vallitalea guaymasensis]QUH28854.1 flippase-like domain-containing protein [Vallitalea guaymasensis]